MESAIVRRIILINQVKLGPFEPNLFLWEPGELLEQTNPHPIHVEFTKEVFFFLKIHQTSGFMREGNHSCLFHEKRSLKAETLLRFLSRRLWWRHVAARLAGMSFLR